MVNFENDEELRSENRKEKKHLFILKKSPAKSECPLICCSQNSIQV